MEEILAYLRRLHNSSEFRALGLLLIVAGAECAYPYHRLRLHIEHVDGWPSD